MVQYALSKEEKLHIVAIKVIGGLSRIRASAEILAEIDNNPAPDHWDDCGRVGKLDVLA